MNTIANCTISNAVAILPGPRVSFLDHLIPLCHKFNAPLVCTDHWVHTCAQLFYPKTELLLANEGNLQQTLSNYQTFITVEPSRLHPKSLQFGEFLYQGEAKTIAGFHGNPDKFRDEYWIERYVDEDVILVYGEHTIDYFKEKGVWNRLQNTVTIGNIRKTFYHAHKSFFDQVAKPHLFEDQMRTTVFFAPTWSFPEPQNYFSSCLDEIPEEYQVLVKLHPFMYRLYPRWVSGLKQKYAKNEQVLFLDEIPLIYPLIEHADIYLGDYSSVAYDFLSVNRPLFFIGDKQYSWGTSINDLKKLWETVQQRDSLFQERNLAYQYVFRT